MGSNNAGPAASACHSLPETRAAIGRVSIDRAGVVRDDAAAGLAVIHIGRGDREPFDQGCRLIASHMGLIAVNGFPVLVLVPAGLIVILAGRGDDGGIDQRALLDR